MARHPALVLAALSALLLIPGSRIAAADQVTIYRCTDANGKLTLRDTPCAKGQQQQTRSMLRPKDAPVRAVVRRPPAMRSDFEPATTRVVVLHAPRPLYECVSPDGERYTSETADGAPRWVPLWTLGYPVHPQRLALGDRIGGPLPRPVNQTGLPPVHPAVGLAYTPGTWIRDACYALPQAEVCDRLVDRRSELRRRFFNAMPSERDVLRVEERGINARLDNDCGVG